MMFSSYVGGLRWASMKQTIHSDTQAVTDMRGQKTREEGVEKDAIFHGEVTVPGDRCLHSAVWEMRFAN